LDKILISKRGLAERVYDVLKQQILDQQLVPGTRLNIDNQARLLGVSSTPVREALNRLTAEKLVVSEHYSGYRVAPPITFEYLRDLLDYRILLEGYCALVGAPIRNQATISNLAKAHRKMAKFERIGSRYEEHRQFVAADNEFHVIIVESAGNWVLSEQYRSLNAINLQSRLYLNRQGGAHSAEVIAEHAMILNAFEVGDGIAAKKAVHSHLEGGKRRLLKIAAQLDPSRAAPIS
jgi:DNA-binding GntR family transcriptional regulator